MNPQKVGETFTQWKSLIEHKDSIIKATTCSKKTFVAMIEEMVGDHYKGSYTAGFSGYFWIHFQDHHYRRHVDTYEQRKEAALDFCSLAGRKGLKIDFAPEGPDEGNYWYEVKPNTFEITNRILVDPGA